MHRLIAVTIVGVAASLAPLASHAQTLTRGPYLQVGTDHSVIVVWDTNVATDARVQFGTSPGSLTQSQADGTSALHHEIQLNGLTANTLYYYSVGTGTAVIAGGDASHRFRTAPTPGTRVRFRSWVVGDSGTGGSSQAGVRDAMLNAVGAARPDLFLHVGDMAYNSGTTSEFTNNFFAPYAGVLQQTITWPAMGNHEGASSDSGTQTGPYYSAYVLPRAGEAGGIPSGTEAYYSFDWANAHFVVLDSHDSPRGTSGAMLTWMQQDLAATTQEWLIAFWHHPPYTKGTHDSDTEGQLIDMRENALPILEAAGVDLVLTGHSHIYERSYLLDGAYATPTTAAGHILDPRSGAPLSGPYAKPATQTAHGGTVYVTAGHGGAGLGGSADHPVMFTSDINFGSCILDIDGNRLEMMNIRRTGIIQDRFAMVKGTALIISAPTEGAQLGAGSSTTIAWSTVGTVARVRVSYSPDGGSNWTVLAPDIANGGSYAWTTPVTPSATAVVKVEDVSNANVFDVSNGFFAVGSTAPQVIVPWGGTWSYDDTGTDLGTAWTAASYDDSSWPTGNAQLGYGDGDEATTLTRRNPTQPSYYFRRAFTLDRPVQNAALSVLYDDGFAVWLNGTQVMGRNVADGTGYSTFASAGSSDNAMATDPIPGPGAFVVGTNVLAVVVKQESAGSSDVSFDLQLTATLDPIGVDGGAGPSSSSSTASSSPASSNGSPSSASNANSTPAATSSASASAGGTASASSATTTGGSAAASTSAGSTGQGGSSGGASGASSTTTGGDTAGPGCTCRSVGDGRTGALLVIGAVLFIGRRVLRRKNPAQGAG